MKRWVWGVVLVSVVLGFFLVALEDYSLRPELRYAEFNEGITKGEVYYFDRHEVRVYYERSSWVAEVGKPYSDIRQEYPPLGVLFISLPRIFSNSESGFTALFITQTVLCFALLIVVTRSILKKLGRSQWALLAFGLPSILYFTIARFDIFVSLLVMISLWLLLREKFIMSLAVLGFAALAKWYPLLLIPFFVAYGHHIGINYLTRKKGVIWSLGIFGGVTLLSMCIVGIDALFPYALHASRSFGLGTIWSIILMIFGNVFPALLPAAISLLGYILFAGELLPTFFGVFSYQKMKTLIQSKQDLIQMSFGVVFIFVFFAKIFSPQWELWWLPLALLVFTKRWEWGLLVAIDLITFAQFPVVFHGISPYSLSFDLITIVRSALFSILLITIVRGYMPRVRALFRETPQPPA